MKNNKRKGKLNGKIKKGRRKSGGGTPKGKKKEKQQRQRGYEELDLVGVRAVGELRRGPRRGEYDEPGGDNS